MESRFSIFDLRLARRLIPHMPARGGRRSKPAFTLLELVLVLFVIALMFSMAAPSMQGWGRTAKLRDAGDQFQAAARWARTQAIATGTIHRIEVEPAGGGYAVTRDAGGSFVAADGEFGQWVPMPAGFRIELIRGDFGTSSVVEFSPTGRITPAEVRISAATGQTIRLAALSPAQLFERVDP